jgi:hypothetical protein
LPLYLYSFSCHASHPLPTPFLPIYGSITSNWYNFLRNAKINYLTAARSSSKGIFRTAKVNASEPALSWWNGSIFNTPRFLAYQRAYKALILAAICYKYVDDLPSMPDTLQEAQDIFDEYQKKARSSIERLNTVKKVGAKPPAACAGSLPGLMVLGVAMSVTYITYKVLDRYRPGRGIIQNLPELQQLQEQATMFNDALAQVRQGPAPIPRS